MKPPRMVWAASILAGLIVPAAVTVGTVKLRAAAPEQPAPALEAPPAFDGGEKPAPKETPKNESKPPADTTPPALHLYHPTKGARVETESVTVKGAAETGAAVWVAGERVAIDDRGRFAREVGLKPGRNLIVLKAMDAAGNKSFIEVAVYRDAEEPKPDPVKTVESLFDAKQTYGVCDQTPPYDVFYGTAAPGALVKIKSEFGNGATYAGKDGSWEIKVFFPDAPLGKTFPVKAWSDGAYEYFEFTATGGETPKH